MYINSIQTCVNGILAFVTLLKMTVLFTTILRKKKKGEKKERKRSEKVNYIGVKTKNIITYCLL